MAMKEYDVYLKDTRTKDGETTFYTVLAKNVADAKKQAREVYKPFMKIIKVKFIRENR